MTSLIPGMSPCIVQNRRLSLPSTRGLPASVKILVPKPRGRPRGWSAPTLGWKVKPFQGSRKGQKCQGSPPSKLKHRPLWKAPEPLP